MKKSLLISLVLYSMLSSCSDMKTKSQSLVVNKVFIKDSINFESVSKVLEENTALKKVDWLEWKEFSYMPQVSFRIAHADSLIFLKYYVKEEHILAKQSEPNTAVHRDSCVEFFLDPMQDGNYYNFEFNCIGTSHLAYGPSRMERNFISAEVIKNQIITWSTLGDKPFEEKSDNFEWEMVIVIPSSVFIYNEDISFSKLTSNANFYKCGDDTTKPHYLSWNPVKSPNPDFHRPENFGILNFQ